MSMLDLEKLLRVPYVDPYGGFEFSPDGARIAFTWNRTGQWEIYELKLDSPELIPGKWAQAKRRSMKQETPGSVSLNQPGILHQVTEGTGAKFSPHYSPDGKHLAYVLDLDGSEAFDVFVCDLAEGVHTNITPNTPYAIQPNLSWSPDGSQIAFISNQSGHFDTYVMPASGGEPRLMFGLNNPDWDVLWSPDGRWLAIVSEGRGQDYMVNIVPTQGGEPRPIAVNGKPIDAREARWSPDSRHLAFSSDFRDSYDIGIYDVETGHITWVTSGSSDKGSPDWSPNGKHLAYVCKEGPDTCLVVHKISGGRSKTFQVEPGVHYCPRFAPDNQRVAFIFGSPRRPEDLWLLSVIGCVSKTCYHNSLINKPKFLIQDLKYDTGFFQQLTHSLPDDLHADAFVMPTHVYYPSLDGKTVPALLFQPPCKGESGLLSPYKSGESAHASSRLPPAVVVIHGGPSWLYQYLWSPIFQHMASRGWIVLAPNYRGSTGYGREWQLANRFDMGRGDTMDIIAGADYLIREGLADPAHIAVTGRSHGGYLTMSCLTQYPEYWAGGSAVVPFLNWFTSHANSRQDLQHWDIENMGDPQENYGLWRERSPFFFLDRVKAPVQLICGANDPRCSPSESSDARDALLALGKEVDFVFYPDEGHGFLRIENVVDHELRRMVFLARVLQDG